MGDRRNCKYKDFCGMPKEIKIKREAVPAAATARMDRAALDREAQARSANATLGSAICIETHKDEQTHPWVVGKVVSTLHEASEQGLAYDVQRDGIHLDRVRAAEPVLTVQLYEAVQPGSNVLTLSDQVVEVAARRVRVVGVQLTNVRSCGRLAAAADGTVASRRRVQIEYESLLAIRAEMPRQDDEWVVERVAEYRMLHGVEQWLVKWKDYTEAQNTWEPWEHLLTAEVQAEALLIKDASLPRDQAGLAKVTVARLKDALRARGLDSNGLKAELAARLYTALCAQE